MLNYIFSYMRCRYEKISNGIRVDTGVEWKKIGRHGGKKGGKEEEDGRRWQEAIRNTRQKQPTSKSLSNLIGVIESFRLLRH